MPSGSPTGTSPWAALQGVPAARVMPVGGPVSGTVTVPGSKSVTNRALILAAAAAGESRLSGVLRSDDSYWCLDALERLGLTVAVDGTDVAIGGQAGRFPHRQGELFIGSAGTIARFLPGVLAAAPDGMWRVSASDQLSARPVAPLFDALATLGARIETRVRAGAYPADIAGGGLNGGSVTLSGALSSQFISGVLMAAPLAAGPVTLTVPDEIVQADYVRITLDTMAAFGAEIGVEDGFHRFTTAPTGYRGRPYTVEADASTSTYFMALAAVTGGTVTIDNIGTETRQPDIRFADILERMGAVVARRPGAITVTGPPRLKGGFTVSLRPLSDATLTLAAIAPFADGPITVTEVAHIRMHESDRIAVAVAGLTRMGIRAEERPDGLTVHPGTPRFAELETHDDHRVAMAFALTGLAGAGVCLSEPGCVSKTCPVFFDLLAGLGVPVDLSGTG